MKILPILLLFTVCFFKAQKKDDIQIIFDNKNLEKGGCYRIPSFAKLKNNTLIAITDERLKKCDDLRSHEDINIVLRKSFDGGKTWQKIERIVDFPYGESASDASVVIDTKNNDIYLFYNYMNLLTAKNIYKQQYVKSSDNGKTWSKPVDITDQIAPPNSVKDFKFVTSGRGYYTSNNIIMNTLVDLQKGVFLFGSQDAGKTWKLMSDFMKPADESNIVEISNGKIFMNARVNYYGKRRIYIINNNGKIEQSYDDNSLVDPGCNAAMLKLRKGGKDYFFFSNVNNPKVRNNLGIRYSTDYGKTWSEQFPVYTPSSAYSSIDAINKRKLGILFEKDEYTQIAFKIVNVKDVLNFKP